MARTLVRIAHTTVRAARTSAGTAGLDVVAVHFVDSLEKEGDKLFRPRTGKIPGLLKRRSMPIPTAYADIFRNWDGLIAAAKTVLETLPEIEPLVRTMERIAADAKKLKWDQDELQARRQKTTQDLQEKIREGRDFSIILRGIVRSRIGPRNERLVQFGIAPIRKRGSRSRGKAAAENGAVPPPAQEDPQAG